MIVGVPKNVELLRLTAGCRKFREYFPTVNFFFIYAVLSFILPPPIDVLDTAHAQAVDTGYFVH